MSNFKKINDLKKHIFSDKVSSEIMSELKNNIEKDDFFVVFISVCAQNERVKVFRGAGSSLVTAWANAEMGVRAFLKKREAAKNPIDVSWVKAEVMDSCEELSVTRFLETFFSKDSNYGLALGERFEVALLQSELIENRLILRDDDEVTIDFAKLFEYARKNGGIVSLFTKTPEKVIRFATRGFFCVEEGVVQNGTEIPAKSNAKTIDKQSATVGFWALSSELKKMTHLIEQYFSASCMHNVNFFAFCANDVDLKTRTINGTFWENGEFIKKTTSFPDLFDMRLGNNLDRKNPEIAKALKQTGYQVSRRTIGDKSQNARWLLQNKTFADFVIESQDYPDCNVKSFLDKHKTIILKPSSGSNGRGIYKIEKRTDDEVFIHYLKEKNVFNLSEFIEKNHDTFVNEKYMVQHFVDSTTVDGMPMDVRLDVARGKGGAWKTSALYVRFGGGSYVGTNMGKEQRTRATDVKRTLAYQFGDEEGARLNREIEKFAETFPEHFQKKLKFITPELAIDLGIDRNSGNKLKIFEVGVAPGGGGAIISAVPPLNIQFYKYLIEEKLHEVKPL